MSAVDCLSARSFLQGEGDALWVAALSRALHKAVSSSDVALQNRFLRRLSVTCQPVAGYTLGAPQVR